MNLRLADSSSGESKLKIDVLIGADYYWYFITNRIIVGESGPVAVQMSLGCVLSGKMEPLKSTHMQSTLVTHTMISPAESEKLELNNLVKRFWEIDSIASSSSQEILDTEVIESFKKGLSFDGSRYTASLPWKQEIGTIPDNYILCKGRLRSLLKRLRETPILLKQYDDVIKQQEADETPILLKQYNIAETVQYC